MNATNRPVDLLLNIETIKPSPPLQRDNGRETDVSALNKKKNSFDEVYRQQRRDDTAVRQQERQQERVSQQSQRAEQTAEARKQAQPVAVKEQKTTEQKSVDGKALPHKQSSQTSASDVEKSVIEDAGFELQFTDNSEADLDTDITVQFDTLVIDGASTEEAEQLSLGLTDEVVETEAEAEVSGVVINQQTQTASVAKSEAESKAASNPTAASVSEMVKELKQSRLGEAIDGALKGEVNNGSQAKPVTGNLVVQDGQVQQDRFTQMPLGQELKILREQVKMEALTSGADKVVAADSAKTTEGGDRQARINTLAQASQNLSQLRPGTVTTTVQAPVSSPDWGQAVAQRIVWLVNRGISSAELQLNPRELGPVDVRINMSGEQATVQFTSQQAAVREALESSVLRLREMLENSGLNLADVNVSDQSQSDQAHADSGDTSVAGQSGESDELNDAAEAQVAQRIETDSLIDLHA